MNSTKHAGITLAVVTVAVGVALRYSQPQSLTIAHADDDPPESARSCDVGTLFGSFGFSTTGFIVSAGPVGPVADVGTISFDGHGNALQRSTVSLNGTIIPSRVSAGTYTVNSDCTGSSTLVLPPPAGVSQSNFVIVGKGQELRLINTGTGRVLVGNARKQ